MRFRLILAMITIFFIAKSFAEKKDATKLNANPKTHTAIACGDRVQGFNIYETRDKAQKIIEKHTVLELADWTKHSTFEGLLVKKDEPADSLEIEFKPALASQPASNMVSDFSIWDLDKNYKWAKKINPLTFLDEKSGHITIRLKLKNETLCTQELRATSDGD
jgi:hypothetical protein